MQYPIFSKMTYERASPEDIRWASETIIVANLKSFPPEFSICEYDIFSNPPSLCVNPLEKRHILFLVIFANDFNALKCLELDITKNNRYICKNLIMI